MFTFSVFLGREGRKKSNTSYPHLPYLHIVTYIYIYICTFKLHSTQKTPHSQKYASQVQESLSKKRHRTHHQPRRRVPHLPGTRLDKRKKPPPPPPLLHPYTTHAQSSQSLVPRRQTHPTPHHLVPLQLHDADQRLRPLLLLRLSENLA